MEQNRCRVSPIEDGRQVNQQEHIEGLGDEDICQFQDTADDVCKDLQAAALV